jgi:hypothetical protein
VCNHFFVHLFQLLREVVDRLLKNSCGSWTSVISARHTQRHLALHRAPLSLFLILFRPTGLKLPIWYSCRSSRALNSPRIKTVAIKSRPTHPTPTPTEGQPCKYCVQAIIMLLCFLSFPNVCYLTFVYNTLNFFRWLSYSLCNKRKVTLICRK